MGRSMTRTSLLLSLAVLLAPVGAAAQDTTADGVIALAHGDAKTAARILALRAESATAPDSVAQYFLGLLYESGIGVTPHPVRACGLFTQAAVDNSPFAGDARARAFMLRQSPVMAPLCDAAASAPWRMPPPSRFQLGPRYSVATDDDGITVTRDGDSRGTRLGLGGAGWVFLPFRHTTIDMPRSGAVKRHFIEMPWWMPDAPAAPSSWTLMWVVVEIVGLEGRMIAGHPAVAIVPGAVPPTAVDLDSMARLQVNAAGDVERYVASGPNTGVTTVPLMEAR
jgi:hypothetical protein